MLGIGLFIGVTVGIIIGLFIHARVESPLKIKDAISQQYYELLYSVEQKWPNETRHQTALRYIQQAEKCGGVAKQHHT